MAELHESIEKRRSIYSISKESTLSEDEIISLIGHCVKHVPSAYNSQAGRVVILFGKDHDEMWDIVLETLRGEVPPDKFGKTEEKILSFKAGFGTALFFEEQDTIKSLQTRFPLFAENFALWSIQSSGMLQFAVWTSLEEKGMGASLQHYNPLIDSKVRERWGIPDSWKLWSQMPFGKPTAPPGEKEFLPLEKRIKVYGK